MDFFFLDTNILDSWSPEAGIARFRVGNRPVTVFFFRWGEPYLAVVKGVLGPL